MSRDKSHKRVGLSAGVAYEKLCMCIYIYVDSIRTNWLMSLVM